MRQRVGIARALASDPAILLADEAFGHLDEVTGGRLRDEFRQVAKDRGKTVLHVTHSIDEAITLSDRILVFSRPGRIAADVKIDDAARGLKRDKLRKEIYAAIEGLDRGYASEAAA
jgi:NitT/TauT family transport system ATP-binding protein